MEMQELIAEVQRLKLCRDETLVIKLPGNYENDVAVSVKERVQHITGHARILIMPLNAELLVISPESAK